MVSRGSPLQLEYFFYLFIITTGAESYRIHNVICTFFYEKRSAGPIGLVGDMKVQKKKGWRRQKQVGRGSHILLKTVNGISIEKAEARLVAPGCQRATRWLILRAAWPFLYY
jgi:hypothetical protein